MGTRTVYRYAFNEAFFEIIDTEEKAYWLGFITADGCIRTDNGHNTVQVKLKQSDAAHLNKLQRSLGLNRPLLYSAAKGVSGASATLSFSSKKTIADLSRLSVLPRKSLTAVPWKGPEHLMQHYWRGMVDGDGMVAYKATVNKWCIFLCGSEECVTAFAEWARNFCPSKAAVRPSGKIFSWQVQGRQSPQSLARVLYGSATVYLDRKCAVAQTLINSSF